MSDIILYDEEFVEKSQRLRKILDDAAKRYYEDIRKISTKETPKSRIEQRPDGYDYIKSKYMEDMLEKEFPGWSWIEGKNEIVTQQLPIWVRTSGTLKILSPYLMELGAPDPYRYFYSLGAARIQYKSKTKELVEKEFNGKKAYVEEERMLIGIERFQPHYMIDLDKQEGAANTNAFKRAVNRLCHIGDDVYGRRPDDELNPDQIATLNSIKEKYPQLTEYIETNFEKITPANYDLYINQINKSISQINNKPKEKETSNA